MKANAPEKIYCESDGLGNIVKVHNIKWPDDEAENIEYTRTDAFIEKACEWIKTNMDDYIHVEYDTVTGKPTNEGLKKAARIYEQTRNDFDVISDNQMVERAFKAGAKWQKERDNIPQELSYWEFQKVGGNSMRDFINAVNGYNAEKESVSDDLEEASKRYATEGDEISGECIIQEEVDAFNAGANWQKQRMMKDAVEAEASYTMSVPCITISLPIGIKVGDKVKLIIIKED